MLSTLHIVSSILSGEQQRQLEALVNSSTSLIFVTDGVYMLRNQHWMTQLQAKQPHSIKAIVEDCEARGLSALEEITQCDYDEFVAQAVAHKNSLTW